MTNRRRTRRRTSPERDAAAAIAAAALVITIEHWWGYAIAALTIGIATYAALKARRPRSGPIPAPMTNRRTTFRYVASADCAGNDHGVCEDRKCLCPCPHPSRQTRPPADYPDKVPF